MEVEEVRETILKRMNELQHTYASLGDVLNVDKSNIYNRINKRQNMTYASLKCIFDVLGLEIKVKKLPKKEYRNAPKGILRKK